MRFAAVFCIFFGIIVSASRAQLPAPNRPVEITLDVKAPLRFVAYGDARFHDPNDKEAATPAARQALVQAIAEANPAFISFGGDLVYNGFDASDWEVWDKETAVWSAQHIPVYPAIGNHELHGGEKIALPNYFKRFPYLQNSRHYSVRAANALMLVLDSSVPETSGPQGRWLAEKFDRLPSDVDFVFVVLHHPLYTSSSDMNMFSGGGHSARPQEKELAAMLEARQQNMRARVVVFSSHVHNYERHEHGGVTYFVTGGGGAHPYLIDRKPGDLFQGKGVNFHYLLAELDGGNLSVSMRRLDLSSGKPVWSVPDSVTISTPAAKAAGQGK